MKKKIKKASASDHGQQILSTKKHAAEELIPRAFTSGQRLSNTTTFINTMISSTNLRLNVQAHVLKLLNNFLGCDEFGRYKSILQQIFHPRRTRGSQPGREKRRDESFQARAEEPTLFFGSSCNEKRCVTTQRTAVEQTTLPLGLQASNFS